MNNAEVIQVGTLYPDTPRFKNRTSGRVYDVEGISPTINTCQGGENLGGRNLPTITTSSWECNFILIESDEQETCEDDKGGKNP